MEERYKKDEPKITKYKSLQIIIINEPIEIGAATIETKFIMRNNPVVGIWRKIKTILMSLNGSLPFLFS